MDVGEIRKVTRGECTDLWLVETGMFDVTGYGGVYLLDAERPAIVETGTGANVDVIRDAMARVGIAPEAVEVIAVTHVHLDHAGGAGYLAASCPNATVVVSDRGAPHLVDPSRLVAGTKDAVRDQWRHYAEPRPIPEARIRAIDPGARIDLGDRHLVAHPAPGHARHQLVFEVPEQRAVFTGDAAGLLLPGRNEIHQTSPPPEFDLEQAIEDVATLQSLDVETLLYTHFGEAAATNDRLSGYQETLQSWVRDVERVAASTESDEATIEYFTEAIELADVWSQEKAAAEIGLNVRGVLAYLERREK